MSFGLPSVSDLIGTPGLQAVAAGQSIYDAAQQNARTVAAYNALRNIYGPQVGNLNALQAAQAFGLIPAQTAETNARTTQLIPAEASNLNATAHQTNAMLPGRVAQQGATLAATNANTALTQGVTPAKIATAQAGARSATNLADWNQGQLASADRQRLLLQAQAIARQGGDPSIVFNSPAAKAAFGDRAADIGAVFKNDPTKIDAMLAAEHAAMGVTPNTIGSSGAPNTMAYTMQAYGSGSGSGSGAVDAMAQQWINDPASLSRIPANLKPMVEARAQQMIIQQGLAKTPGEAAAYITSHQQNVTSRKGALAEYTSSSPNSRGQTLLTLNTVVPHIELLGQYAQALNNGDVRGANTIKQEFQKQFGSAAPTNFDAQKLFVAEEMRRYFAGGRGSAGEVQQFQDMVSRASSRAQLVGVIHTFMDDIRSKYNGIKQWAGATGTMERFNGVVTPETRRVMEGDATAPKAASGQFVTGQVYRDAQGRSARWDGRQFVPVQ